MGADAGRKAERDGAAVISLAEIGFVLAALCVLAITLLR